MSRESGMMHQCPAASDSASKLISDFYNPKTCCLSHHHSKVLKHTFNEFKAIIQLVGGQPIKI